MVLNTLIYIALIIVVIIVIVVLLKFLFGVLFILPTETDNFIAISLVVEDIPIGLISSELIRF
jgi:hypothetical protein